MASDELRRLRQSAINKTRYASRKVNALANQNILVLGSKYDPRKSPEEIAKMDSRQARAYVNRITKFNSGQTKFVAASEGAPVPAQLWESFQKTQANYNKKVEGYQAGFKDIFIDHRNMTIGQFDRKMTPDNVFAKNRASHKPFIASDTEIENVTSADNLKLLQNKLRQKMKKEYSEKQINDARDQLGMMLDSIGDTPTVDANGNVVTKSLKQLTDELTDNQFNVLWFELDLADNISDIYGILIMANTRTAMTMHNDRLGDAKEIIQWGIDKLPKGDK